MQWWMMLCEWNGGEWWCMDAMEVGCDGNEMYGWSVDGGVMNVWWFMQVGAGGRLAAV